MAARCPLSKQCRRIRSIVISNVSSDMTAGRLRQFPVQRQVKRGLDSLLGALAELESFDFDVETRLRHRTAPFLNSIRLVMEKRSRCNPRREGGSHAGLKLSIP